MGAPYGAARSTPQWKVPQRWQKQDEIAPVPGRTHRPAIAGVAARPAAGRPTADFAGDVAADLVAADGAVRRCGARVTPRLVVLRPAALRPTVRPAAVRLAARWARPVAAGALEPSAAIGSRASSARLPAMLPTLAAGEILPRTSASRVTGRGASALLLACCAAPWPCRRSPTTPPAVSVVAIVVATTARRAEW